MGPMQPYFEVSKIGRASLGHLQAAHVSSRAEPKCCQLLMMNWLPQSNTNVKASGLRFAIGQFLSV